MIKKLVLSSLALMALFLPPVAHANELAVGKYAKTSGTVQIPVVGLTEMNYITTQELYKMRTDAVDRYRQLLLDTYEPNDAIFGACESKKPWWGIWGLHLYREGQQSIVGPAKESVYILNPFRLVSAEAINVGTWDRNTVTRSDMQNPDFPVIWKSGPVSFYPCQSMAEVTYDITKYNADLRRWQSRMRVKTGMISGFSLIAYNARDFNLNYIYLDPHKSGGVKPWAAESVPITQMLHCGSSCGYPGGCNNMSPHVVALDNNMLTALPARACLKLWKEEPDTVGKPADFTYIINFK